MRLLEFQGYVAPGVLLVTASACALEVVRGAWARNVLKPPNNYVIAVVGECLHVCYWLAERDCSVMSLARVAAREQCVSQWEVVNSRQSFVAECVRRCKVF